MKLLKITIIGLLATIALSQPNATRTDVHLFQSFFADAGRAQNIYAEGFFLHDGYDGFSSMEIGGRGGYPLNENLEVGGALSFMSWSPDEGDGESGLADVLVNVRYHLDGIMPEGSDLTAGGFLTLPIGEEKVGQGNFNFGGFAALRHPMGEKAIITGTAGLDLYEVTDFQGGSDRETALRLGGGAIVPVNEKTAAVAELVMRSKGDYMLFSAGADYTMGSGRLRAGIGLGLDDGAPDFSFMATFLMNL